MNRRAMIKHFILLAAAPLLLAGCSSHPSQADAPLAGASIGGPFTLTDQHGQTRRWSDFAGSYRIVYFGYTFCPDACPTDVGIFTRGLNQFAKEHPALATKVQPIFITVDPERDNPAALAQFTAAFSPRLIGLTGSRPEIDKAIKEFRVYATRGAATPGGGYLMDHSRAAYLFDPEGKPIEVLPTDKNAAAVAAELEKWVT